jgi:hypothetical protein
MNDSAVGQPSGPRWRRCRPGSTAFQPRADCVRRSAQSGGQRTSDSPRRADPTLADAFKHRKEDTLTLIEQRLAQVCEDGDRGIHEVRVSVFRSSLRLRRRPPWKRHTLPPGMDAFLHLFPVCLDLAVQRRGSVEFSPTPSSPCYLDGAGLGAVAQFHASRPRQRSLVDSAAAPILTYL